MNIYEYTNRINYTGSLSPTLPVLAALQRAHLLNVPFENLDIHRNVPIILDVERVFQKIIVNKRGGFCYELNELFLQLITAIGFEARRISAGVYNDKKEIYGNTMGHQTILVNLDGEDYLTDVGFGTFTFGPLHFKQGKELKDERGRFFFDKYDDEYFRVNKIVEDKVIPEYIFKNETRVYSDFEERCHYQQTSPESHFTQKRLISIATPEGRVTITGNVLKITTGEEVTEREFREEEYEHLLLKYFKVKL